MKKLLVYLFALTAWSATIHAVDETTPIVPVEASGYFRHDLLGATDNIMSLPLARPPVAIGYVSAVTSNTLTVSLTDPSAAATLPSWTTDQFKYDATSVPARRETYYAEFTEGPTGRNYSFTGVRYKIIANSQDTLTLDTEGDNLTSHPRFGTVQPGDTLVIRPYWRIRDVFELNGAPVIESRSVVTEPKDDILIPDNATVGINKTHAVIYHLAGVGWRADGSALDMSDLVLPPGEWFRLKRRNSANLSIPIIGNVAAYPNAVFIAGGTSSTANDVYLSAAYPFPIRLRDSSLYQEAPLATPVQPSLNRFQRRDIVLFFYSYTTGLDIGISGIFYYLRDAVNSRWTKAGNDAADLGDQELPVGKGVVIRKGISSPSADWLMPVKRLGQLGELGYPTLSGPSEITVTWPSEFGLV